MICPAPAQERPILLIKSGGPAALPEWQELFHQYAPQLDVHHWNDKDIPPERVEYVLVWQPQAGRLRGYPNLRAILSSAAGVDHILADPHLPAGIPIVRMVTQETRQRMAEFAAMACLMTQKSMHRIIAQQRAQHWEECLPQNNVGDTRVGIMGLGSLGAVTASYIRRLGFQTQGWSQSRKTIPDVRCYAGPQELSTFLGSTDILICLLPETAETHGIISRTLLQQLPDGASVINLARGSHLITEDLLTALDSGHIASAWLDVVDQEPLPRNSPLWHHPAIIITPHSAASPSRREKAIHAASVIHAIEQGQEAPHLYDPGRGY